jgi:cytochrome c5
MLNKECKYQIAIIIAFTLGAISNQTASASETAHPVALKQQLQDRLAPVGKLHVAGQATQPTPAAPVASKAKTGEDIYEKNCITCHDSGIAGAPRLDDKQTWQQRFEQKGLAGLFKSVIHGRGLMPARGTCNDCSDADLEMTINYMLNYALDID